MKINNIVIENKIWIAIPKNSFSILFLLLSTGCSSLSIDAAKSLSSSGKNIAIQTQKNVLVSDDEYLRARDVEALMHGFSGAVESDEYNKILQLYNDIHQELSQRSVVFENLTDVYDAFGDLAGLEASKETEIALGNLGGAINQYANTVKAPPPISNNNVAVISKIGGLIAEEIQKEKIKEASAQIRKNLIDFLKLLETPLIREQQEGIKQFLASSRKSAIDLLWNEGLYDATPLLNEMGTDAALIAQKDAMNSIKSKPALANAIGEVINKRLAYRIDLIERAYSVSLISIRRLIAEHEKLEKGEELDIARLRGIVSNLRGIAVLLSKPNTSSTTTP